MLLGADDKALRWLMGWEPPGASSAPLLRGDSALDGEGEPQRDAKGDGVGDSCGFLFFLHFVLFFINVY